MQRSKIRELLGRESAGDDVLVQGWVKTRRSSKAVSFVQISDGSTLTDIQVVADESLPNFQAVEALTTGCSVSVVGTLVDSPGKGQKYEIHAKSIEIVGESDPDTYPLQKKRHTVEFLRDIAHLRPRTNTFGAMARVRNALAYAIHGFFQEKGFLFLQAPMITTSDAEGAGAMFRVTTLDLEKVPMKDGSVDVEEDFFGKPTFLTVSGQLEAESFALALSDVYTFGPTFRAENSNTSRHLAEFWMVEPEVAFCDLDGLADLSEEFLKHVFTYVLNHCQEDLGFFNQWYDKTAISTLEGIVNSNFERLTYTEAVDILQASGESFEFPVVWGSDLQSEHERYLAETKVGKPVIVTDYPKEIKAFYMRMNEDEKTVRALDVLVPRIGEIIGGSQREERRDVLLERMRQSGLDEKHYWWYLDLRSYGTVPHAGFGLGFERTVQFVTGVANIRDVMPFPRTPNNAEF
ncbi:MAG TPA: asparagine--tRNA ligase [Dehalococcoidia bacterium]|mgnify:FL=1|uniref:asparagine--tRNA ligase n=1 Tax=hydrothermal vent metagenome TaxID=652676 RepID=A0A160V798_9ZZZZ|nr:asparagine--tRNA ligase [Dehalococcoidia bacterium]HAI99364.1 asparagine--tRNA ligase [Dehalococcoidia bacterium]|tara:strand:+ start:695 stop:2080 length:1386 start_codon:yes stop_codon:yes gene_type:complete